MRGQDIELGVGRRTVWAEIGKVDPCVGSMLESTASTPELADLAET